MLVTGATGFIGSRALEPLRGRGFEVLDTGSHTADLLDPGGAGQLIRDTRPTHLLHFAWYTEHRAFWTSPENVRWAEASLRLLRAFAEGGGERAVLAGTCAEYDWSAQNALSERSTRLAPTTLYGASKHGLHTIAQPYADQVDVALAWGRIFFLYGPGEHRDRLVASVARSLILGLPAPCSSGEQVRDFLHVADVADAFAALLDSDVRGPVNIGSGEPVSVRDVALALGEAAGRPDLVRLGAHSHHRDDPPRLVADSRRLREEVGWRPSRTLEQGLRETLDWWRLHGET